MLFGANEIAAWARINFFLLMFVSSLIFPTSSVALSQFDMRWIEAQKSDVMNRTFSKQDPAWLRQSRTRSKRVLNKSYQAWINSQEKRNDQIVKEATNQINALNKIKVKRNQAALNGEKRSLLSQDKLGSSTSLSAFSNLGKGQNALNKREASGIHSPQSQVLIFISFSMPINSIKSWLIQARRIHAPLILRGLVDNDFIKTRAKINALLKEQSGGIQIDPLWYQEFHIRRVPAVVVRGERGFDVALGDVGLEASLNLISERGENERLEAKRALKRFRADSVKGAEDA